MATRFWGLFFAQLKTADFISQRILFTKDAWLKRQKITFFTGFCHFYFANRHETPPICSSMWAAPRVFKIVSICAIDSEKNNGFILELKLMPTQESRPDSQAFLNIFWLIKLMILNSTKNKPQNLVAIDTSFLEICALSKSNQIENFENLGPSSKTNSAAFSS